MTETVRLPPQNIDAERSVLGTMLRYNEIIPEIAQKLGPDDFYSHAHQQVFRTMVDLFVMQGESADTITVRDALERKGNGLVDEISREYLDGLREACPNHYNIDRYWKIVRDKAIARRMIHACDELSRDAFDQVMPSGELADKAVALIAEISQSGLRDPATIQVAVRRALDQIGERSVDGYRNGAVMTGLVDLDNRLGGLQPGELVVIAGRTSEGKTALALNLACTVAADSEPPTPTLIFSLEQSLIEIGYKVTARYCGINSYKFRRPSTLNVQEQQALIEAEQFFKGKPFFIDDNPNLSTTRIIAATRRMKVKHGIRLVMVDYLQLVIPDDRRDPRYEQVAAMTRGLKMLAREASIPVVILCQLNREATKVEPRLSHLRESGNIEQDADAVLLISKADALDAPANALRVDIAKNRGGPTGELFVIFDKATGRISNLTLP